MSLARRHLVSVTAMAALVLATGAGAAAAHEHGGAVTPAGSAAMPADAPLAAMPRPGRNACSSSCREQLAVVRAATRRYRDPAAALRDGFQPSMCMQSVAGAMGEHWTRWDRMYDQHHDIRRPEQLLYLPTAHGPRLVAVEWSSPVLRRGTFHWGADAPRGHLSAPPTLFGHRFDGPMAGHTPQQPWHYDLHVWLWRTNPAGTFARYNPAIACPAGAPAMGQAPMTRPAAPAGASYHGVLTSRVPDAATGYTAEIHSGTVPGSAHAGSALRSMRFTLAPGFRIDTRVPVRCTASDDRLRTLGPRACPAAARVGVGGAVVGTLPPQAPARIPLDIALFNTRGGQIVLVADRGTGAVMGIARVAIRGRTFTVPLPTCLAGGQPPRCQTDQVSLLEYHEHMFRYVRGGRSYRTAPAHCPPTGHWTNRATLTYADGAQARLRTLSPCRIQHGRAPAARGSRA